MKCAPPTTSAKEKQKIIQNLGLFFTVIWKETKRKILIFFPASRITINYRCGVSRQRYFVGKLLFGSTLHFNVGCASKTRIWFRQTNFRWIIVNLNIFFNFFFLDTDLLEEEEEEEEGEEEEEEEEEVDDDNDNIKDIGSPSKHHHHHHHHGLNGSPSRDRLLRRQTDSPNRQKRKKVQAILLFFWIFNNNQMN